MKVEFVPSVAELPTFQYTLHAWAPLTRVIVLPAEVIKVEAAWKMKTALASPCASRVNAPELAKDPAPVEYVPAVMTWDASSGEARTVGVGALMSLNAVTKSVCAVVAVASAMCRTPRGCDC